MNILHVHSGNIFGGVERMLETLSPVTSGRLPVHSTFALCFDGVVSERLRAAGAAVHLLGPVHARQMSEIRHARRALSGVLQSERWDAAVVHSAWSQAILGPTILNSRTPLVRWLHAPEPGPRLLEFWARRSRPSRVLCNSQYTRDAVGRRFGSVPLSILYPPSPAEPSLADARSEVRASVGTSSEAVTIMIAARIEPWKGHELLIDSLAALEPANWEAWIVGEPQRSSERAHFDLLLEKVRAAGLLPRVRFLGQRSDVPRLLQAADIYCQPNQGPEPFGLAFVEALSAGLPVLTTRLGAAPEIVDSTCGSLVEPGSVPALTAALTMLIERADLRRTLSIGALARARQFCDIRGSLLRLSAELAPLSARVPSLT